MVDILIHAKNHMLKHSLYRQQVELIQSSICWRYGLVLPGEYNLYKYKYLSMLHCRSNHYLTLNEIVIKFWPIRKKHKIKK